MDKAQAINDFWNSFKLLAYDENTVPDDARLPYITYDVVTDSLEGIVAMSASLWYRSNSWREISQKANEIEKYLGEHGGVVIKLDNGRLYITKGQPFAQRMSDSDDTIRRIILNIQAEYLTAY